MREILQKSPEVNQKDKYGRTALHYAARAGNLSAFMELCNVEGIDKFAVTNSGVDALMMGVESGNL